LRLKSILDKSGEEKTGADWVSIVTTWIFTPLVFGFPLFITWFTLWKARELAKMRKINRAIKISKKLKSLYEDDLDDM